MAKTTPLPQISLSNDGNKLRITYPDGTTAMVTVVDNSLDDKSRGRGVRVRHSDGSRSTLYDDEMEARGMTVEVVH